MEYIRPLEGMARARQSHPGKSALPPEQRWMRVLSTLNEFQARLFVAQRALELGRGGISRLAALTGMSRPTITKRAYKDYLTSPAFPPVG